MNGVLVEDSVDAVETLVETDPDIVLPVEVEITLPVFVEEVGTVELLGPDWVMTPEDPVLLVILTVLVVPVPVDPVSMLLVLFVELLPFPVLVPAMLAPVPVLLALLRLEAELLPIPVLVVVDEAIVEVGELMVETVVVRDSGVTVDDMAATTFPPHISSL